MSEPHSALARAAIQKIVARVIADHPQDHYEIWSALLVELLASGLYSEDLGGGSSFAAALNHQLARLARQQGDNIIWQLMKVNFALPKETDTPRSVH